MDITKDIFELSIEKVSKTIKSCKNYNQVKSCESLLYNFKLIFENEIDEEDFDQTYLYLESQLKDKKTKYDLV
jgi:hypothetical protein